MNKSDKKDFFQKALSILFWLALWQAGAMALNKSIILVTPVAAVKRLFELIPQADFWRTVLNSFLRIGGGSILALIIGTVLAALSARYKLMRTLISPLMTAVKAVPVASFIIFALFFMKSRELSVLISFLMVLPVIYEAVLELKEAAEVFRLDGAKKLRYLYFPAVMPFITAACRTGAALAFKSGTAAEVIGQPDLTMGDMLYRAKIYLETADLFAWTLVIIILAKLFELLISKALGFIYKRSQKVKIKGGVCSDDK